MKHHRQETKDTSILVCNAKPSARFVIGHYVGSVGIFAQESVLRTLRQLTKSPSRRSRFAGSASRNSQRAFDIAIIGVPSSAHVIVC